MFWVLVLRSRMPFENFCVRIMPKILNAQTVMLNKKPLNEDHRTQDVLMNELERYCFTHTSKEPDYLLELIQLSNEHMEFSKKISGRIIGRLLKLLVQLSKPTTVLVDYWVAEEC